MSAESASTRPKRRNQAPSSRVLRPGPRQRSGRGTESSSPPARLYGQPKYVVSATLAQAKWNNSTLLRGNVLEEIANLKHQPGNELQVHGSATLIRTLMEQDFIDEYRLLIHPVVLG
jgi:dihydrofolate reductase